MKQLSGKIKIIALIIIAVIIAGIIMIYTRGISKDIFYSANQRIEVTREEVEVEDIKKAAGEIFGQDKIKIQTIGDSEEKVAITLLNVEDENYDNFINKLKELNNNEEMQVSRTLVGKINFYNIVEHYIAPFIITTVLIVAYMMIRYRKYGILKQIIYPVMTAGMVELLYLSIIAIFNLPVGIYTMPIAVFIYALAMICVVQKPHNENIEDTDSAN